MKKYFRVILIGLMALSSVSNVVADGLDNTPLVFNVTPRTPGDDDDSGHTLPRTPIAPPTVAINGHTLYLYSGCDNTEIVLIGDNETEVYSTYVLEGTTQVQLPSVLQGTYELRILRGQYMFYTEIEL